MSSKLLVLLNFAATLLMTGVIWQVQLVTYPIMGLVGKSEFTNYHAFHTTWITPVVGPPMLVELITAILLVGAHPEEMPDWAAWVGLGLCGFLFLSTGLISVPLHNQLATGYTERAHSLLVSTNWIRTVGWTLRAALMMWVMTRLMSRAT